MSRLAPEGRPGFRRTGVRGELVFTSAPPPAASMFQCLRMAWAEALLEADCAYEVWGRVGGLEAYVIYRAAADRADAAQDALAGHVALLAATRG